jgi:hypothetical protein
VFVWYYPRVDGLISCQESFRKSSWSDFLDELKRDGYVDSIDFPADYEMINVGLANNSNHSSLAEKFETFQARSMRHQMCTVYKVEKLGHFQMNFNTN